MNVKVLSIVQIENKIIEWATDKPFIQEVHLFGSRIRGLSKNGHPPREDSDLDVALVFNAVEDMDLETTWTCEFKEWRKELNNISGMIHLNRYNESIISDGSRLIYNRVS